MNIRRLFSLWDNLSCGEEFSEVGLAIIKAFKKQLANVDDEERLKVFLQLARLKGQHEHTIDRVIRGFDYKKEIKIKFTDVAEGPVSVVVEDGDDILVSSVEGDNIFAVFTTEDRTVNLFLACMYPSNEFIIKVLKEWDIDGFTVSNKDFPIHFDAGILDESTIRPIGYDPMWSPI